MKLNPNGVKFSSKKPNVIVGPNGSGKSALLTALSLKTLSNLTGESTIDGNYITAVDSKFFWTKDDRKYWANEYEFLQGLECVGEVAPALYYRPDHIPGNESGITVAMMCGYFEEAKEFAKMTRGKSSGQKSQALLQKVLGLLAGQDAKLTYGFKNWRGTKELRDLKSERNLFSYDYQFEALKVLYGSIKPDLSPIVLMDEPEQSLDARAELLMWNAIANADISKMQIIVATHSLYPLMNPKKFNIIESSEGYAQEVMGLLKS